jgi:glycosyltransferase involved in cell wall biosynthesis
MVLPPHNEEENIARCVEAADTALEEAGLDCELIVINDGSRHRTGEILEALKAAYPRLRVISHLPE